MIRLVGGETSHDRRMLQVELAGRRLWLTSAALTITSRNRQLDLWAPWVSWVPLSMRQCRHWWGYARVTRRTGR